MIEGARRILVSMAAAFLLTLCAGVQSAFAETPTPTPAATAAATTGSDTTTDAPDVAPDNSAVVWALGAAGVLAVIAGAVVFLRRN